MPRLTNTKELIMDAALDMFSERGYDGVGMRDLARRVGVRESALYKHFRGKQDIFNTLLRQMKGECDKVFDAHGMSGDDEEMIERYRTISVEEFIQFCFDMFLHNIKDERTSKFRKILRGNCSVMRTQTAGPFCDEEIGSAYYTLYIGDILDMYSVIFKGLIDGGVFIEADPYVTALHFYSPIFLLLTGHDEGKIAETEALDKLERHVRQFLELYKKR